MNKALIDDRYGDICSVPSYGQAGWTTWVAVLVGRKTPGLQSARWGMHHQKQSLYLSESSPSLSDVEVELLA